MIRAIFAREPETPPEPDLFAPDAWLRVARQWCAEAETPMERWSIDWRFMAAGQWYQVTWEQEEWRISAVV